MQDQQNQVKSRQYPHPKEIPYLYVVDKDKTHTSYYKQSKSQFEG